MSKKNYKIIKNLILKSSKDANMKSETVSRVSNKLGANFVKNHFTKLKRDLLNEISIEKGKGLGKYISVKEFFDSKNLSFDSSHEWVVCKKYAGNTFNKKHNYLINLVFPCRNSEKTIKDSLSFLISEISKTHNIDFNVVLQINNTFDNTVVKISETLISYKKVLTDSNFFILETPQEKTLSISGSLNIGQTFLQQESQNLNEYEQVFFSFWDDQLYDLIPRSDSIFNSNISTLLSSELNKAISGYMIDNRTNISKWHDVSKGFSADIRFIHIKPYLHGGAGTVMRWEDFPKEGIKSGGIADTDLSAHLLSKINYETLKDLSPREWPVRSNHRAPVFHPIETNVLKWTTKYLMYRISWENTYTRLNETRHKIGDLWKNKIDENRSVFHKKINNYLVNLSPENILDREFMHYYYFSIDNLENKPSMYKIFKKYRQRSLEITI